MLSADAGSTANPTEEYFVLGGACVYEAQVEWLSRELDKLATCRMPGSRFNWGDLQAVSQKSTRWLVKRRLVRDSIFGL